MQLVQNSISICWIILLIYWIYSARSVKKTEEKVGGIGGYWHWVLMVLAFMVTENTSLYPLGIRFLSFTEVVGLLSILFAFCGLVIAFQARRILAENWSGSVTFKKDHELITSGIYQYIRHPIYTGILLMFIGSALLIGTVGSVLGFLILTITFWLKLKQEEELMTKHFPKEYPAYKKRVKALIPFVV